MLEKQPLWPPTNSVGQYTDLRKAAHHVAHEVAGPFHLYTYVIFIAREYLDASSAD